MCHKQTDYYDESHLCQQAPELTGTDWEHWFSQPDQPFLNPTPHFFSEWYAWQNPDWCHQHASPYSHYLNIGRHEGRDPSPFVDMVRFRQAIGTDVAAGVAYDLLLMGRHAPWVGVYSGADDLVRMQERYYRNIKVDAMRASRLSVPKKSLVFLQSGRGALTKGWFESSAPRNWDILVNYYDAVGFEPNFGDYVFFQKGTKFTAMWALWRQYQHVIEPYDHVLFLDDDVETSVEDLNQLFECCHRNALDLAQMTLTPQSSSNWSELFDRSDQTGPRTVSAVEIMMPAMSRKALSALAPTFGKSVSGFGLDLTWGHIVRQFGGRIAVIDGIAATHARPVDQGGGAYYAYLRSHGINAKAELWSLLKEYGADRDLFSG